MQPSKKAYEDAGLADLWFVLSDFVARITPGNIIHQEFASWHISISSVCISSIGRFFITTRNVDLMACFSLREKPGPHFLVILCCLPSESSLRGFGLESLSPFEFSYLVQRRRTAFLTNQLAAVSRQMSPS